MTHKFHEESLAVPYRVEFNFSYDELKKEFDAYWEEAADALIARFKPQVKKAKGGIIPKDRARKMLEKNMPPGKLYQGALAKIIDDTLSENDRSLFAIDEMTVFDYAPDKEALVVGVVFYWPKMTLKDASAPLVFSAKQPFKPEPEKAWEGKKSELWHKYKKVSETEVESGPIQENHDLLVDIIASCDGAPYEAGTVRGRWFEFRTLNEDLRAAFSAHQVGDLFETDFTMTSMDPSKEGQKVHAHVKIFKAREVTYREVDNSMAVEEGHSDLESMKANFYAEYFKHVEDVKRGVAAEAVIQTVLQNAVIPPLPDRWVDLSTQRLIDQHVAQFRGDRAKAMAVVHAQDEDEFRHLFRGEVHRDIYRQCALRLYKALYNLGSITDEELYRDMMSRINWIESEPDSV